MNPYNYERFSFKGFVYCIVYEIKTLALKLMIQILYTSSSYVRLKQYEW